jgi:hypothetical protein
MGDVRLRSSKIARVIPLVGEWGRRAPSATYSSADEECVAGSVAAYRPGSPFRALVFENHVLIVRPVSFVASRRDVSSRSSGYGFVLKCSFNLFYAATVMHVLFDFGLAVCVICAQDIASGVFGSRRASAIILSTATQSS